MKEKQYAISNVYSIVKSLDLNNEFEHNEILIKQFKNFRIF